MTEQVLVDIITCCLEQDRTALDIYRRLSESFEDPEIAGFWRTMGEEEQGHVSFWEALLDFARQGHLPQVFEDPAAILASLSRGAEEVRELSVLCQGCGEVNRAFILCYRLESALMHPAFETLFRFAEDSRLPLPIASPETEYTNHIQRFIDALKRFGGLTKEMELIGELLVRLWEETRSLVAQVHTDSLTGILNRRGFFKVIDPLVFLSVRNAQSAGLLMIDLDKFKDVNDAHGHQVGDKVLASVAAAVQGVLRRSDVVGRYGGEEFIAYLPGCEHSYLKQVAEKIRGAVEDSPHHGVAVTVSVGAAHLDTVRSLGEVERLINSADQCLYLAKRDGRNRVFVDCPGRSLEDG